MVLVVVLILDDDESFVVGPVFPVAAIAPASAVASASEAASLPLLVAKKASFLFLLSFRGRSRSFLSRYDLLLLMLLLSLLVMSRLRVVDWRRVSLLAQKGLPLSAREGRNEVVELAEGLARVSANLGRGLENQAREGVNEVSLRL